MEEPRFTNYTCSGVGEVLSYHRYMSFVVDTEVIFDPAASWDMIRETLVEKMRK